MRSIRLRAETDLDPVTVFIAVADFDRYPSLAADVREVRTVPAANPDAPKETYWEVYFRRGIMRWTETDVIDLDRLRIEFEQLDGDFEDFHGSWQVTPVRAGGAEILFEITYDFGIDSLAGLMDPIAERVIKRAVCEIFSGLFGDVRVLEGAEALTDLGALLPAPQPAIKGAS